MSPKALDYESVGTETLAAWLKHPRNAADARKIREELDRRGMGRRDTGTLPLFGEKQQTLNVQRSTLNEGNAEGLPQYIRSGSRCGKSEREST